MSLRQVTERRCDCDGQLIVDVRDVRDRSGSDSWTVDVPTLAENRINGGFR